ncbi:MAG: serine acetyltransferase [Armatimonadetes bacterium]|nr:serine acetyltransferase [Armatimonadota bacterium]
MKLSSSEPRPSREAVVRAVEALRSALFPGYFGATEARADRLSYHLGVALDLAQHLLQQQIARGFCFGREAPEACHEWARHATRTFLSNLPRIREHLAADVLAAFEGDPAATMPGEVIFCYPSMVAVTCYRLAHELHRLGVPLIPRMITEHAHGLTGIDIHPGAEIQEGLFIDHGTGVVIGETCSIGRRVRIYQGVTLGARSFPLDEHGKPIKGVPRHPIVEDEVTIYAGATVLGRVTIGRGSVIGGNVWLTRSVPPGSRVSQARLRSEGFEGGAGI